MKDILFKKSYTRDTTLIIQQLWFKALTVGAKQRFGIDASSKGLFGVDYINDGAIEIWENNSAKAFIKENLAKKSFTENKVILEFLNEYEAKLADFGPIWKTGFVEEIDKLSDFVNFVDEWVIGDLVISYLPGMDNVEKTVKEISLQLRESDHYFAYNDSVLRQSLQKIYPNLSSYVTCIQVEEIKQPPSLEECQKRYNHFISTSDGYFAIETLQDFHNSHKEFVFEEDVSSFDRAEIIKGRIAEKGKVRGVVKIIRRIIDLDKIETGDVIVSPMTTPALIAAIKKVSAIITDEGGVACHAAIIAREMKKPCVTSTKIATKVLKDGDLVEVDANNGIVKVLRRAN